MPLDTKKLDEMNITRFLYYVSNLLILYNFLTFVVGYRPDEPNYAQQTMYYTLWEMKDMEKRGMDEVRYDTVCIHKENLLFHKCSLSMRWWIANKARKQFNGHYFSGTAY